MNTSRPRGADGEGESKPTKDFGLGEFSARALSEQLDALGLDDDDDDDENDPGDPMNITDFLNSNGDLTGLSEWTDSEHDELEGLVKPKHRDISPMDTVAEKTVVPTRLTERPAATSNPQTTHSPPHSSTTIVSPCCKSPHTQGHTHPISTQPLGSVRGPNMTPDNARGQGQTQQMFTRAPNFRTPGGYKPPLIEKEPRNLTDEQLLQEVKEMYAEDRLLHGADVPDSTDQDKDSLEFLLKDPQFGKMAELSFGEGNQPLPVEEPLVTESKAWVCNKDDKVKVTLDVPIKIPAVSSRIIPSVINAPRVSTGRRSPNSRKDNLAELSRLWDEIQDTKQRLEHDMSSLVNPISSDKGCIVEDSQLRDLTPSTARSKPQSQLPPQAPSASISRRILSIGKRTFVPESPTAAVIAPDKTGECGDTADGESTKSPGKVVPKRSVRKTKGKHHRHWRQGAGSSALVPLKPNLRAPYTDDEVGLNQDEVDEILQETDIQESELDDLLSEISDYVPDVGVSEITNFFKHPDFRWANGESNGEEETGYKQKYFEERYRRDHCENEISRLQKELLEVNEKVSVSDGIIHGKEATITKLNKVYQRVQIQWKSHEKGCKEELTQIRAQNAQLRGRLGESKERISVYEEELEKAIEVSENFKAKVEMVLEDLEVERSEGREQKEELAKEISSLKSSLTKAQAEKESALRALRECHETLDVTKKYLADTSEEVRTMSVERESQESKIQGLVTENQSLKLELSELCSKYDTLREESVQLKEEKVLLESESRRKLKEEREKLHDYYNTKIKEILQTESQKMIEAEREFVKLHEQKLEQLQTEAEERLEKMRTKFTHQVQQMKSKFETQLGSLKKENDEQAKLIGTVSQQLRNFSERDDQQGGKRHNDETLTGTNCHNSISSLVEALNGRRGWIDMPPSQPTANKNTPTS